MLQGFINRHKAGSPTDASVFWIHLRPSEIAREFEKQYGIKLYNNFIKRVLTAMGFKYRKMSKQLPIGHYGNRDRQFRIIFDLVLMLSIDSPVISIDCKKKERLGNLYRDGKCYAQSAIEVFDHDYQYLATGKVVPFAIYDLLRNQGYISIGTSAETAAFIYDCLIWWWDNYGIDHYADAGQIIILCDAGGANSYRHHAFKKYILQFAAQIGRDVIVAHYPPYASKWNPIEHRLFPHMHRAMEGVVLANYDIVVLLAQKTATNQGLNVKVRLVQNHYPIGIKTKKQEVDYKRIKPHKLSPKLTYLVAA